MTDKQFKFSLLVGGLLVALGGFIATLASIGVGLVGLGVGIGFLAILTRSAGQSEQIPAVQRADNAADRRDSKRGGVDHAA